MPERRSTPDRRAGEPLDQVLVATTLDTLSEAIGEARYAAALVHIDSLRSLVAGRIPALERQS